MRYQVYSDEYLIFDSALESYNIINPQLDLELNKTGTFSFTIYPDNPNIERLQKLKSIITVYQNDYIIFRGRILNDQKGWHNERQVSCEGELAFLLDSIQRPYDFSGSPNDLFAQLINAHNEQVDDNKKFLVGNITVTDPNDYIARSDTQYLNTLDSMMEKLVTPLGGYLFVRHETDGNYIDWVKDFDILSNQTIEFGKNLIELNRITKGEQIATAIIPLGAKISDESEERLTITEINDGVDYVFDRDAVEIYGWIFKSVTWDDVTVASNLLRKANEYLGESKNLINSIELSAIDFPAIGENPFRLGTYVSVFSRTHSLDSKFLVCKLNLNLMSPSSNKLTLNATYSTFTEQTTATSKAQGEVYNKVVGAVDGKINNVLTEVDERTSSIVDQSATEIVSSIRKDYYLKSDAERLVESINTQFAQTNNSFDFKFNQFSVNLEDIANGADARFNEINKYIRFVDGDIILGEAGNELILRIENDKITFLESGKEIAYWKNRKFYAEDGEFFNTLRLGTFGFIPRNNGNLSIKKLG